MVVALWSCFNISHFRRKKMNLVISYFNLFKIKHGLFCFFGQCWLVMAILHNTFIFFVLY